MKVLYYMLDTISSNAAYLHAVGNRLNLESGYTRRTFRHAFIAALATQLIEPQLKLSQHESMHWETKFHKQIFEAEKELYEGHLSAEKTKAEEKKSAAAMSSHLNPIQSCAFCGHSNLVRVVCDVCRRPVCGLHRVKIGRNQYHCNDCRTA
jgi:hypothetical protein